MAVVVAPRPRLGWWDRLYIPAIVKGLGITLRHLFKKKVTLQFPEEKWTYPPLYRGYPELIMGENGIEKCVACKLCEVVCPPIAITINIGEYSDQDKRERVPAEFVIDMGRCILCGMCEEACPVDAIRLSNVHVMSSGSRESVVFKKQLLLEDYQTIETMRP
ncbi:MAG TPA: NADH-quinone oxidoreductase subunit NuoI [Bdellovibrionota bacterium]|nr:NADH-quinone oxidoreductase subunit NuoI [Bdellovibrionota bacterium]